MGASPSSTQRGWSRRRRFSFQRQPTRLIWLWRPRTFCCLQAHAQVHGTNTESVLECCKHAHKKHSQVAWTSGRAKPVGGHRAIQSKGFLVPGPGLFENLLKSAVESGIRSDFMARGFIALTAVSCGTRWVLCCPRGYAIRLIKCRTAPAQRC